MTDKPTDIQLPDFDWDRMAEVAADELCTPEEHPDHEACAACLAIRGTRWALAMRSQLEAGQSENVTLKEKIVEMQKLLDAANLGWA